MKKDSNSKDENRLGNAIYDAREAKGLSSRSLAERISVHHSYIARLQLGEYKQPAPEVLESLSSELDLSLADLYALAGYSPPTKLPSFEGFLHTKYRQLPNRDVQALRGHLDYLVNKASNETDSNDTNNVEEKN